MVRARKQPQTAVVGGGVLDSQPERMARQRLSMKEGVVDMRSNCTIHWNELPTQAMLLLLLIIIIINSH
jgi:hypothetical protein